jgi:hypothetical protein
MPTDPDVAEAFATADHRRIGLEQGPQFKLGTSLEGQRAQQFRAECFESMRAWRSRKRKRPDQRQERFHELRAFWTGFEV